MFANEGTVPLRTPHAVRFRAVLLLGVATSGCATNTAPAGWLRPAEEARLEARGGWAELVVWDPLTAAAFHRVEGELIAAEPDTLFLLTDDGLEAVPLGTVRRAKVTPWLIDKRTLGGWMAVGTLSTISHGYYLVLSAPVWLIIGGVVTARGTADGQIDAAYPNPTALRIHARFPQGLLPGIDRAKIERGGLARPPRSR